MTVRELKNIVENYPDDAEVVVYIEDDGDLWDSTFPHCFKVNDDDIRLLDILDDDDINVESQMVYISFDTLSEL